MSGQPLASVLLTAHSQFRGLLCGVARRLGDEQGARVHLLCTTKEQVQYYQRRQPDLFASIAVNDALYAGCRLPVSDPAAVVAEARGNEDWLGTTINELAVSDRHLGRGYALGGLYHPRSRISENTSYLQMLHGFNRLIEFWRGQIAARKPDLVLNGDKVAALICRREGIPYRTIAPSRYQTYFQWARSEFYENPEIEQSFRRLRQVPPAQLPQPYQAHLALRQVFLRESSLPGFLGKSGKLLLRRAYWRLRGYEKGRGYRVRSELRYLYRQWRDRRQLTGPATVSLSSLEGRPFVYYPLHTEPETALQMLSPEYFYQLSCIAALSRDLPAGVLLAVKDIYYAVGRRPADFYTQIREFKNVVLLDMLELGLEVVRKCSAVATITGTGGFEGAVLGKPVITFGRHNQYNCLPHVFVVTDERELKGHLRRALSPDFDPEQAARDGARLLQAVIDNSFDLKDFSITEPEKAGAEVIDAAYRSLVEGLGEAAAEKAAAGSAAAG
jgi:hypothetical protein